MKLERSLDEHEMKQDLSRAIDCSSFRIKPLGATGYDEDAGMDITTSGKNKYKIIIKFANSEDDDDHDDGGDVT